MTNIFAQVQRLQEYTSELKRIIELDYADQEPHKSLLMTYTDEAKFIYYVELEWRKVKDIFSCVAAYAFSPKDVDVNHFTSINFDYHYPVDKMYDCLLKILPSYAMETLDLIGCSNIAFQEGIRKAFVEKDKDTFTNLFHNPNLIIDITRFAQLCQYYDALIPTSSPEEEAERLTFDKFLDKTAAKMVDAHMEEELNLKINTFEQRNNVYESIANSEENLDLSKIEKEWYDANKEMYELTYVGYVILLLNNWQLIPEGLQQQVMKCIHTEKLANWWEEALECKRLAEMEEKTAGVPCPISIDSAMELEAILNVYKEAGDVPKHGKATYHSKNRAHLQAVTMALIDLNRLNKNCIYGGDDFVSLVNWLNKTSICADLTLVTEVSDFREGLLLANDRNETTIRRVNLYADRLDSIGVHKL